jgi:GABA(A) receptor-associated protein
MSALYIPFKNKYSFEERLTESCRIKKEHSGRIPIICERSSSIRGNTILPIIDKTKYLVPHNFTVCQFMFVIRNRLQLDHEEALYLVIGDSIPPSSALLDSLYQEHKDKDGFLYVQYMKENVFGQDSDNNTKELITITKVNPVDKEFFVYMLSSEDRKATYVGATVDLNRRLRQHNGEIKGGAVATTSKNTIWTRIAHVSGFPTWQSALQFEWRWKQLTRKIPTKAKQSSIQRRFIALKKLLQMDKPTTKAEPYSSWTSKPQISFLNDHYQDIYITTKL